MLRRLICCGQKSVKYTPKNGKVAVTAVKDKANNQVVIKIADTGIGIAQEYFEKIFERFYRIESSRTTAGTGLGLSLSRTIVRQHKGDILITCKEPGVQGSGCVFIIILPYCNLDVIESSY